MPERRSDPHPLTSSDLRGDDEKVARFRSDVARLLGQPPPPDRRIALAVSGGPDSMAMLALAAAAFPGQVLAATVDHGLRAESAGEAAMVAGWCAAAGIDHATLAIAVPPGASGNLHAWARQERYLLLKRWAIDRGASALATAHHAEDQAETFLMRAARGSGVSGLAAIRARLDEDVPLPADPLVRHGRLSTIRPLLDWRRHELRTLCEALALPFVDDPSNRDPRFDRSRFRRWLEDAPWLDPVQVGRSAAHLAETDADLKALTWWLWERRAVPGSPDEARFDVADLPRGVRRWLARTAIDSVRTSNAIALPAWSHATNIEPLLDALDTGRSATQAGVLASASGTVWHFRQAPPRRGPRSP